MGRQKKLAMIGEIPGPRLLTLIMLSNLSRVSKQAPREVLVKARVRVAMLFQCYL